MTATRPATLVVELGMTAEYVCPPEWGADAGRAIFGDVVKAGKSYADVTWRESGRTERVRFRDARGVIFKAHKTPTARSRAGVTAAKIQHVAKRIAEGFEIFEADTGVYMVWKGTECPIEVVASLYGRAYVWPIPRDADPDLTADDLIVKYADDREAI